MDGTEPETSVMVVVAAEDISHGDFVRVEVRPGQPYGSLVRSPLRYYGGPDVQPVGVARRVIRQGEAVRYDPVRFTDDVCLLHIPD